MKTNETMMQFFEWYLPSDGTLWKTAVNEAPYLAKTGITQVWFPPAYKGAGGKYDVGYSAYDLYDLGEFDQKGSIETKYGTKDEYINAIKKLHENGIYTVLFMSPIFLYITNWKEIIEISKDFVDEFWFENLNLRGSYKYSILNYIKEKYSDLFCKYIDIYENKNNNYWIDLSKKIEEYGVSNNIKYTNFFYHKELVDKKKGIKND